MTEPRPINVGTFAEWVAAHDADNLFERHAELVDKKFLGGLSEQETAELVEIHRQMDAIEVGWYDARAGRDTNTQPAGNRTAYLLLALALVAAALVVWERRAR